MRLGILNLKSIKTRITFASTAIFVFGIWILSYYAGISLQEDAKKLLGEQQASTLAYISYKGLFAKFQLAHVIGGVQVQGVQYYTTKALFQVGLSL